MEHITDLLLEAREELKRLEHIIYVSLKYTRTVDVIINALDRLIDIYNLTIEALLEKAKDEDKISALPKSPALRATRLSETYPEDLKLKQYLSFYSFLKSILNMPCERRREYRRHVTLVVRLEKATAEANIDNLTNCERYVHHFFDYAWELVHGKKVEED
jgi:hypothetical protein